MKALTKSTSTSALPRNVSPGPVRSMLGRPESGVLNTIPDPRTPSPNNRPGSSAERPETPRHPDLNDEVATLSTKLINAINHQTNLDDNLQQARAELDMARRRIGQLETDAQEHARVMQRMVKKEDYDNLEMTLRKQLLEEKKARFAADQEKKRIENELEALTTALFQEANTMVAAARKETEASERRVEQYKTQLKDAELLLASHQEQLRDLKEVMAAMTAENDDKETTATTNTHNSTAPSTPAAVPADRSSRASDRASLTPNTPHDEDVEPAHPLHFTHLISPVLRTDVEAYSEFQELLRTAKTHTSLPTSRTTSGNYGGLNVMGLGSIANISTASLSLQPTNSSETSLPKSVNSVNKETGAVLPALKEIKFYKRALTEDIEPTLRLDNAPGLSWLARRTVLNSMTAGSLTIEPQPPYARYRGPVFACSLCGENRVSKVMNKDGTDPYARKHRFRTSDEKDAQRYPLCDFCLGRVRSCCDYISFLRLCRDGHWRAENGDEEKSAWEESVRLRERMFWARVGGGVVPAYIHLNHSPRGAMAEKRRSGAADPRKSVESELKLNHDDKGAADQLPDTENNTTQELQGEAQEPLDSSEQESSIDTGRPIVTTTDSDAHLEQKQDSAVALDSDDERRIEKEAAKQLQSGMRKSLEAHEGETEADKDADDKRAEPETQPAETPEIESEKTARPEAKADDDDEKKSVATQESDNRASLMPGSFE
ncbi:GDPGTP exchange factor Sec2p [Lasiodiplodia theobromae]|uniref:Rab guanine nucleotide exchange factor sec2 n=1 Tax=Lasiodiplodia theobromae TaxID=45133 RepID=A0A5N5DR89_9PEZI|nr:GDPGTP exchange factor Sec2p [Lasiodiplodia theobromae]KAB2580466.1 Rab guanine nucleotide exchange factor sec2 [Lasiodiplodia theobromae]KAF4541400.1 GDPGTP exchange factor Sec2p [Lasiodiplodia theobromae]KAF9632636.1 GDPGTP exchange factor Sec2p [Lasiodiplodia theobromae]